MFYGHDPRDIDNYPWRDVALFLDSLPMLQASHNLGGLQQDG